ncbi:MAG: COX15/CtaA family protein, partial [Candidatus Omnitrophica bacterium]|nr:COX15/CtaA family protein [Candidatus Omnitrophota bacterium]
ILIAAGGLVTSTNSGLSVPDWPLSYGSLNPPMVGGIVFEHSHRMIAGVILLGTLLLAFITWKSAEASRGLKIASGFLVVMVLLQALLGGLTVLLKLPPVVSVAHACLAQLFLSLLGCVCCRTSIRWSTVPEKISVDPMLKIWIFTTPAIFFFQLLSGAFLRHTESQMMLAVHILSAFLVISTVFITVIKYRALKSDAFVRITSSVLSHGVVLQFMLGIMAFVILYTQHLQIEILFAVLPTAHQTLGAVLLASAVMLSYRVSLLSRKAV